MRPNFTLWRVLTNWIGFFRLLKDRQNYLFPEPLAVQYLINLKAFFLSSSFLMLAGNLFHVLRHGPSTDTAIKPRSKGILKEPTFLVTVLAWDICSFSKSRYLVLNFQHSFVTAWLFSISTDGIRQLRLILVTEGNFMAPFFRRIRKGHLRATRIARFKADCNFWDCLEVRNGR